MYASGMYNSGWNGYASGWNGHASGWNGHFGGLRRSGAYGW